VCLEPMWRDGERWVIVDGAKLIRSTRGSFEHRIVLSFFICLLSMGVIACEGKPTDTSAGKTDAPSTESRLLRLTPEMSSRMDLQVAQVGQGELRTSREFPATVQANENALAEVTTLIRGRVVKVHVDVGQDVKKSAVLATLHSVDLGIAEGEYLKATARLYEADLTYKRGKELTQQMVISQAELLRREAAMRTARAEAREAENRLALLGVPEEEITRLNREQTIKANVSLRAPFDGRVIMRNITSGEVVETHQKFFTVADLSDMWVVANVPEKDVQFIRRDQTVDVVLAAYPHAIFTGTITYIGDVLDPATRTMRLRVTVPNPERLLKPEMFAIVRVHAAASAETLSLPVSAVQEGPNGTMVFVQRETGAFEARTVKLGDEQGDLVQVLGGVRAGELVVTKGSFALKSEMERHKIEPTS
jgi:membrane fusion protein, heavy metal efflux system